VTVLLQLMLLSVDRRYAAISFEFFTRLSYLEGILSEMNVKIALAWIPGH